MPLCRLGASEKELDDAEGMLGLTFPPAMRAIWRVCDGQALQWRHMAADQIFGIGPVTPETSAMLGLLGG